MITLFEKYNDFEYILDLKELWLMYIQNFEILYPDTGIRSVKKDIKSIGSFYFREDIKEILMGKDVEVHRKFKERELKYRGTITDVWSRYTKTGLPNHLNWETKIKLNSNKTWILIKDKKLKIYSKHRTELEEKLEFLSSTEKYNL